VCGIAGIVELDPNARVSRHVLESMAESIAHRGPDDDGFLIDGNAGLAHRRLSIIDVAGGSQPVWNEDRSVAVVFNGEIYNYAELTDRLEGLGHRFVTRSDTEAIVHGYEQYGADVVDHLRGMFAFAIWDRPRRRLLLARDRLGIKPLYFARTQRLLAFGSEIKALLEVPEVPRELDPEALDLYLSLRYVPAPRTMYRGIEKLEPGHVLVCENRQVTVRRYWDVPHRRLDSASPQAHPSVLRRRFAELLDECVDMHLMSEVPLGVFLSGGLDSTAVLAVADKIAGRPFRTFTVGYEPTSAEALAANEFTYARLAAESFRAEHTEVTLADADFASALPELVWHLDEPLSDPACVPLFYVSRRSREDVTVVLSGEGADEILGGYGIYRRMLDLESAYRWTGGRLGALAPLAARLGAGERAQQAIRLAGKPLERRYRGVARSFFPETKNRLLGRAARPTNLVDEVFARHFEACAGAPALDRMLYVDLKTWLPDELLMKADRMTMASSQELRVPFLDHRLVELAAEVPPSLKVQNGTGKVLLREVMAGRVPGAIIERTKKGFPVPTATLLRRLGSYGRDLLLGPRSACRANFDIAVVENLLSAHDSGSGRFDQEIWSLLIFELWHGVFLDGRFGVAAPRPQRETRFAGAATAAGA